MFWRSVHVHKQGGFTLIELVVVIVVTSILAVTVLPKFTSKSTFDQVGFHDQVLGGLQYARKTAVASRRYVCVSATSSAISLQVDPRLPDGLALPACTVNLNFPAQNSNSLPPPSGVTLASTVSSFRFDPLGRSSAAVIVTVSGQTITVDQETGYVR